MLFERQAVFGYFFYTELVEVLPEKSKRNPSVSQSGTPPHPKSLPHKSHPQFSFLKISFKPPITD
jgi:hypothetical protein